MAPEKKGAKKEEQGEGWAWKLQAEAIERLDGEHKELDKQVTGFIERVDKTFAAQDRYDGDISKRLGIVEVKERKNERRDNLNRNLLTRFGKEMWVNMIIISVVCGFALGVFLVNLKLTQEARQCAVEVELEISR